MTVRKVTTTNRDGVHLFADQRMTTETSSKDHTTVLSQAGHNADVLIVGAGIAGLAVARYLLRSGLSVIVLEARNRVGGRLLSIDGLDLGATWFWSNEPRIHRLISELGIETHDQHTSGSAIYHSPAGVARLDGNPIDGPAGRISSGAQALAQAIADRLPESAIHLDCPVNEIQAQDEHIAAHAAEKLFKARHLVLALPPALAMARIGFEPELPPPLAKLAARTPVWMGATTKVVARYQELFWRQAGLAGSAISHIGPLREIHDMSGPDGFPAALFGFAPPAQADLTRERALAQLVELFGPRAGHPVELHLHNWRDELHTSPPDVALLADYELFGHELYTQPALGGRLHWASTETAQEYPGHIEGALAAAERAAQAILKRMA